MHISDENDTIDLALIYVKGLTDITPLKLSDEIAHKGDSFTIVGYRPHKNEYAKEPLSGSIKKAYSLESKTYKRNIYDLSINEDDSIEQGYSGSAVVSTQTRLVMAVATDRKRDGKNAYATPIEYLRKIWEEVPNELFVTPTFQRFNMINTIQKYLLQTVIGAIILGLLTNFIYDKLKDSETTSLEKKVIVKENNSTNSTIELHNDNNDSTTKKTIEFNKNKTQNSSIKVFQ